MRPADPAPSFRVSSARARCVAQPGVVQREVLGGAADPARLGGVEPGERGDVVAVVPGDDGVR